MDLTSYVNQLKTQLSLVDVIGKVVSLKKAGRNYIGLCPFHGEKTPSFTVSEDKGIFFCFGCKTGGDLIQFYMKYHQVSFKEAVDALSASAGMTEYQWGNEESSDNKDHYVLLMEETKRFFVENLAKSHEGMAYIQKRELSPALVELYQIGFAPGDSKPIVSLMNSKKLDKDKACYLGLLHQDSQGQYYPYFRERIIFPILNVSGKTIGFGGRSIHPGQQPKYVNSPDQLLFHKGQQLYGLYQAKTSIQQSGKVIITEGYMDVLSLAQFGFPYAVATLGTALTKDHTKLLSRLHAELYLCFDHDDAGEKATEKAIQVLLSQGMQAKVVLLDNDFKDPDEAVHQGGESRFRDCLNRALPMLDYYWNRIKELSSSKGLDVKDLTVQMFDLLRFSSEAILHDQMIKKMSYDLHILPNILWDQFRFTQQQEKTGFPKRPLIKQSKEFEGNIPSLEGEKIILKAILEEQTDWGKIIFVSIEQEDFSNQHHRKIYQVLKELHPNHPFGQWNEASSQDIEQEVMNGIMELSLLDPSFINRESIEQVLKKTNENKKKKITRVILQKIKEAEAQGDDKTCRSLREELKKIV